MRSEVPFGAVLKALSTLASWLTAPALVMCGLHFVRSRPPPLNSSLNVIVSPSAGEPGPAPGKSAPTILSEAIAADWIVSVEYAGYTDVSVLNVVAGTNAVLTTWPINAPVVTLVRSTVASQDV